MTAPQDIPEQRVTQADREAAAKALGYRDYGDATDYRLSGTQDRQVADMVEAFKNHRLAALSEHREGAGRVG